ncbi:hypothetical protein ACFQL4_29240 [Halosimplex aquaticum]
MAEDVLDLDLVRHIDLDALGLTGENIVDVRAFAEDGNEREEFRIRLGRRFEERLEEAFVRAFALPFSDWKKSSSLSMKNATVWSPTASWMTSIVG